jgi:hypothetical protein
VSVTVEPGPTATEAALLASFLTGRDVPCPQCEYNLRDLSGHRCPECGEELALRVGVVEPRLAAPITGLIALSAGAGLNALLLLYGLAMIWKRPGVSGLAIFFRCNIIGLVAQGVALFVWLRYWRRIRQRPAAQRWLLVCGCVALTLANLIYFTQNVR